MIKPCSINLKIISISVTSAQIERLYSRFTSLDRSDCGTLSREDFLRIPELAINPLCDRIVHSFFTDSNDDRVNFRQFMQVLARFRTIKKGKDNKLNSREEKLRCELMIHSVKCHQTLLLLLLLLFKSYAVAFKMYDLDDDDSVSKDELLNILMMMVGANIPQEQLVNIAERTILEADQSGIGKITFEDFCKVLERTDVEKKMSIRFLN